MLERIAYSIDDRFRGGRPVDGGSPKPQEPPKIEVDIKPAIKGSPAPEPPPRVTSTTVGGVRYPIRGS